jgi:hypothetical protein
MVFWHLFGQLWFYTHFQGPFFFSQRLYQHSRLPSTPPNPERSSLASPRLVRWEAFPSCSLHVISLLCSSFSHLPFILTLISLLNEEPEKLKLPIKWPSCARQLWLPFRVWRENNDSRHRDGRCNLWLSALCLARLARTGYMSSCDVSKMSRHWSRMREYKSFCWSKQNLYWPWEWPRWSKRVCERIK